MLSHENKRNIKLLCLAFIALPLTFIASPRAKAEVVAGLNQITFNDNGAWSWFEDERAIINDGKLIVGSVADSSGSGSGSRNGNIEVATYDFTTGGVTQFVLHANLEDDDHDSPALHVRPDGRILAVYSKHGSDQLTRWRITYNPGDTSSWQPEQTHNNGSATTYSNVFRLSSENGGAGQTYNFTRTVGWDSNFLVSNNDGSSWSYGGRLLNAPGRPYLKYTSNNVDEIHFITTEQHPRDFDNSIYHGYIKGGQVFQSDGSLVGPLDSNGDSPTAFTQVFAGDANNVAWTTDIHLDSNGHPYIAYSVQKDSAGLPRGQGGEDHRYRYARWNGIQWNDYELAYGGSSLYSGEDDYTGLVALDPDDPNTVYISADVDPATGVPLVSSADGQRHYEIFKGATTNNGASWTWSPITENSTQDNIRPIRPARDGDKSALLWLAGTYSSFTNYDLDVVGIVMSDVIFGDLNGDESVNSVDYVLFLSGLNADLSQLTPEEAYGMGDMNGDFLNNFEDVLLFEGAYNAANGAGSFAAMAASVPEPNSLVVLGVCGLILPWVGRQRTNQ